MTKTHVDYGRHDAGFLQVERDYRLLLGEHHWVLLDSLQLQSLVQYVRMIQHLAVLGDSVIESKRRALLLTQRVILLTGRRLRRAPLPFDHLKHFFVGVLLSIFSPTLLLNHVQELVER